MSIDPDLCSCGLDADHHGKCEDWKRIDKIDPALLRFARKELAGVDITGKDRVEREARRIAKELHWDEVREVVEMACHVESRSGIGERARALRDKLWPPEESAWAGCDRCGCETWGHHLDGAHVPKPSPETLALVRAVDAHLGAYRHGGDLGRALDAWEDRHGRR